MLLRTLRPQVCRHPVAVLERQVEALQAKLDRRREFWIAAVSCRERVIDGGRERHLDEVRQRGREGHGAED